MTTSSVATTYSRRRASGVRQAKPSRQRRTSEIVLVTGTVLAVAAAFGPGWSARAGIAIAVASAIAACVFAWRELFAVERAHARTMLQTSQRHGQQLREEREHNSSVVGALSDRVQEATATVVSQHRTIAALRHEVFELDGDRTRLRAEVEQRDGVIGSLRRSVRAQDTTIRGLEDRLRDEAAARAREAAARAGGTAAGEGEPAAEVHHMPRRVRSELEAADPADGPLDVRTLSTAVPAVLPNYEEDRRFA